MNQRDLTVLLPKTAPRNERPDPICAYGEIPLSAWPDRDLAFAGLHRFLYIAAGCLELRNLRWCDK